MNVRTDDTVIVLSGKDKGKQGKVLRAMPSEGKVIVEGINVAKKHKKPRKQGEQGGIVKMETPPSASKVMRVCPKCSKPTQHAVKILEDGSKVRVCKKCGETI
jgi:large subunit ribosomal protein L24